MQVVVSKPQRPRRGGPGLGSHFSQVRFDPSAVRAIMETLLSIGCSPGFWVAGLALILRWRSRYDVTENWSSSIRFVQ
ncbi:hypothetical protein N431DRAFT_46696 [Stipitochalara longipes BDJ]|nr:hypothetical protein N431DRAFT_46696 [Stipitochalara longipes BDJ]